MIECAATTSPTRDCRGAFHVLPRGPRVCLNPESMSAEQLLDLRVPAQPAMAPDGSRIAFVSEAVFTEPGRREESRIWVAAADGSGARQATWGPGTDMLPAWSPDGRALAFVSDRGHPGRLTVHLLEDG